MKNKRNLISSLLLFMTAMTTLTVCARQGQQPVMDSTTTHIFKPQKVPATADRIKALRLPAGFTIEKFAEGLGKPRMMAVHSGGAVYVTNREKGTLTLLRDTDNDGKADVQEVVANKPQLHGIAIDKDKLYLVTVNEVYTANIGKDGRPGNLRMVISDLPDGGQHGNRTIEFGPDNELYLSVGSTCNACDETNDENATLLQIDTGNYTRQVYAKGLRNTIGFDWHPDTKELYGFDHGIDQLGDTLQHEELNHLEKGKNYGWPYIYDKGGFNLADKPVNMSHEEYAKQTTYPELLYTAHAAPLDMIFYKGKQFPREYNGDAFVTMHGSWNRRPPSGYKIVRIKFENGKPVGAEDFVTGFLTGNGQEQFGRVCGLAMYPDGSLLVSDDDNGVIYRIRYSKQ